ncbi:MAG: asparagine synthase C-terminal domain-containing protein [Anaerolineae bacterium]
MTGQNSSPVSDTLLADLRSSLAKAVVRNPAGVLFFSGGLDTSILALLSPSTPALHICLDDGGPDLPFARTVAQSLGLDLIIRRVSVEEALAAIPEVIRIRRSFDPALPNDLALYFAFAEASRLGYQSAMTGDGADELFAGYSYMFDLNLERYISWLVGRMSFSASELGAAFGIQVRQPYLDREVMTLALAVPPDLKVREQNGQRYGKWVLRRAFEGLLPSSVCWQGKRPVEVGSGFSRLRETVARQVHQTDWDVPVRFLSSDHPYYYRIYRQVVGEIPPPGPGEEVCPGCGAGMAASAHHCRVCGRTKPLVESIR